MSIHSELAPGLTQGRRAKPINDRRKRLFPLLTLGLGTVLAVALGEVALRALVVQEAKRLATYDATLGWRGRPHGSGVYVRNVDNIRVPFRYNNLGFRDEDVAPKPAAGRRILLLGDSFAENLEVEYSKTFPALLERHVKQRSPAGDVAVVGSQGYSTSQELLAFRKYREVISPDIVLLCFYCGNDFEDNLRHRFAYLDDAKNLQIPANQEPKWKHAARWLQRWLYESSHIVFLLKNSLESVADIKLAPVSKSTMNADEEYMHEITGQLIGTLADEVRASGAEFGVVMIPFRDDLAANHFERQRVVTRICADKQIPLLDLTPLVKLDDFFETDIHFNLKGHRVVALAIDGFVAGSQFNTYK